ncbi:Centrosomal protein cep57L1 [Mactra antiquata]
MSSAAIILCSIESYSSLLMGKSPLTPGSYRNHMDTEDSTMYLDYPANKPFINDEYERPPYKPVSTYPQGNRKAVISALKNLQDKIHQLEVERSAAEDNLKSLATETNKYRDILQKENEQRKPAQTTVSKHSQELESQLSAAETRCNLLEKQLGHMQSMVTGAEKDRIEAIRKSAELDPFTPEPPVEHSSGFENNLRKIAELEREHIKLTANQTLAESKIRELEEKLGEERHHRKLMVEKSVEIESVQKANRILQQADELEESKVPVKTKKVKKKRKQVVSKKTVHNHKPDTSKHYRLNLADIPFVAGKNTGPSHSVSANVQKVFSLMKNHNMALCSRFSHNVGIGQDSRRSSSSSSSPTTESDLADILLQLQDEFHQMSFEHQEFSKEINDTTDPRIKDDLERELDVLVTKMEAKSQQIAKIRKYQDKMASKKKKKSRQVEPEDQSTPRSKSAHSGCLRGTLSPRYNGEVEVTTTIKPRGGGSGVVQIRPSSAREISLNVLKDMKKLQSTLRKDDLCWK